MLTSVPLEQIVSAEEDINNVTVSVQNQAYVDVLLSRGKTRANTNNFETDMKTALSKEGVDTTYINFIKNDSVTMVGQAGFNQYTWTFNSTNGASGSRSTGYGDSPGPQAQTILGSSSLGQFGFYGNDMELVGNDRYGGNMILRSTMPSNAYKYTMDFDYNSDFGDNFNGAGVFIQSSVGVSGKGVLIYISNSYNYGSPYSSSGVYVGATINANGTFDGGSMVKSISNSGHLSISVMNGEITINGTQIPGTYEGTDWGFFTSQYSHGCCYTGRFYFQNLIVQIETSKEFKKVLTEEQDNWTSGYTHIMVDCIDEDTETSFMSNDPDYYDVLNLLNISDIHMLAWGTSANKNTLSNYIKLLPNGGEFCDMGSYDSSKKQMTGYQDCINATAKYIANLIKQSMKEDYVVIDNPTSITVIPNSARNLYKWSFEHDISKLTENLGLDNNLGYSDYQGQDNIQFPSGFKFDKPGVYYIKYNGQLVKKITAHRNPTAVILFNGRTQDSESIFTYKFSSQSFDIDSNDDAYGLGKGIKELSWRYRTDGEDWISAGNDVDADIVIDTDKNTDIQLTVTDFLGASVTTTRTINDATKPVAFFAFSNNPISLYENISVIDSSYDALGRKITKREWVLKDKTGKIVWSGTTTPDFTPVSKNMVVGDYTLSLTVTNEKNVKSYTYTAGLTVKKVVANALYQYNWNDAHHDTYPGSVQVEYLAKYPTLQTPKKYYRVNFDKTTGTYIDKTYQDTYSVFAGWFLKENLTNQITPNVTQVKETGNHMIYAKWSDTGSVTLPDAKKIYTVTYNPNGTALDKATSTKASDTETWSLTGWYDKESNGIKVGDKGTVINNVNTNRNYYAYWKDNPITLANAEKKVTISYNENGGTSESNKDTQATEFKGWFTAQNGGTYVGTAGNKYTVNNNHTLYAHFGNAKFILPNAEKDGYTFIGWFSQPQTNDVANNNGEIRFYGKAGQEIQVDSSRILYAWYNSKPVFSDTDISNVFYEGQTINGSDLLTLVTVRDKETQEANKNLVVNLVDVTYKDGTKVPFDREKILDTKTDNIGKFFVKYTVTDYGIEINGNVIEYSPVTIEYVRECEIRYNDLPSIKTEPYLYTYTGDKTLTKDTIESFVKSYVNVNDYQDDIDNRPWWNATETRASLINNIEVVKVTDIQLNSAYVKDNAEFANTVKSINSLQGIYSLKETAPDAFNAITSYNVVFDVKDQWGKYTSGRLSDAAIAKGVKPSEKDKTQTDSDRSVLVICTNDASYNNAYDGLRYVSSKYLDTVSANSYWGDYGKNELRNIFDIREKVYADEKITPTNTYVGVYKKKNGNSMEIVVNDYTK